MALDPGATEPREIVRVLTRYVLALRLSAAAVTVLALHASPAVAPVVLVVACAALLSYLVLRSWHGVAALVLRHPLLLGLDSVVGLLVLAATGPQSPWLLSTLSDAALAGLFYRRRGAATFSSLLVAGYVLGILFPLGSRPELTVHVLVVLPALYPLVAFAAAEARGVLDRAARAAVLTTHAARSRAAALERARLAREMHDSVAKSLYGLAMLADALPQVARRRPDELPDQAAKVAAAARVAVAEGRDLLRDMRADIPDRPFDETLRDVVASTLRGTELALTCHFQLPADVEVTPDVRYEISAVLGEALRNVVRHARARVVCVSVEVVKGRLLLSVQDDGVGFDAPAQLRELSDAGRHGVAGMAERARLVQGRLTTSRCPTGGTRVVLDAPVCTDRAGVPT